MRRLFLITGLLYSFLLYGKYEMKLRFTEPYHATGDKTRVWDKPADWWIVAWTGVGELRDICISNTLQGGIFSRPPSWQYYDGTFPFETLDMPLGLNGEYPAGSGQYYIWAYGLWVGALYPVISGSDTVWKPNVSKCAYYSDLGAMACYEAQNLGGKDLSGLGLYFSDQVIPVGYGYEGEGNLLFAQQGEEPASYQARWPFTDTTINRRRPEGMEVDTGDIISLEDTYACAGDWIPAGQATVLWVRDAGPYDEWGMGIRIEQRTYSWNYDYNNAYVYINWRIRNMNPFPLKNIYCGVFMDNDVGSEVSEEGQGAQDDLAGYDKELDLGYTYDSDGFEPGWETPAGYVGCVFCETPGDKGMTGFKVWHYGHDIDEDRTDSLKYLFLSDTAFMVWNNPFDIRQLQSTGPYPVLEPGEEISFTVALVVGLTLDELKERAEMARKQFENGYVGFAPPPSPDVWITPLDKKVIIAWDNKPESYVCPMSGEKTFEGYRVYKSESGLPGTWELLAEFDKKGSRTKDTVIVGYLKGTSSAQILLAQIDTILGTYSYTITFESKNSFKIYNETERILYEYNPDAIDDEIGDYCIIDPNTNKPYSSDPGYVSGAKIYIDGFYIIIKDGVYNPSQPADISPNPGDVFEVKSFKGYTVGQETGLNYVYVDEDVVNGKKYYYCVTSYSRELPYYGIPSMESGKTGTKYWAIPMETPADLKKPGLRLERIKGMGDVRFEAFVANPLDMPEETLLLVFQTSPTETTKIESWSIIGKESGDTIVDRCTDFDFKALPPTKGIVFRLAACRVCKIDTEKVIDTVYSHWSKSVGWKFNYDLKNVDKYYPLHEYEIRFVGDTWSEKDTRGNPCFFTVWDVTDDKPAYFWFYNKIQPEILNPNLDAIYIYADSSIFTDNYPNNWVICLKWDTVKGATPAGEEYPPLPDSGTVFYLYTLNRLTPSTQFILVPTKFGIKKESYSLDSVRVVPNPYFVKASWDESVEKRKIWFQGLPSECTIRIFNAAGLLIKTIEHKEQTIRPLSGASPEELRQEDRGPGAHAWDLRTDDGFEAPSGLYIYLITTPDGKRKVGKFAIIK